MKSSFLFHLSVAWSSKELKPHRKGERRQRRELCPKPRPLLLKGVSAPAPPPEGRVCSSSSSCGAGPPQLLLLRGMSAPAPPPAGRVCSSPSSRPPGLLQAAEGKSQAIWGFPHRFWKFCFLLFGTTIRGGTGRDRSLWLWHFASVAQILLLKKSLLQAEFYYFFPFLFFFSFEARSYISQSGLKNSRR